VIVTAYSLVRRRAGRRNPWVDRYGGADWSRARIRYETGTGLHSLWVGEAKAVATVARDTRTSLEDYWSQNLSYLLVGTAVFAVGLLFGALASQVLTVPERTALAALVERWTAFEAAHRFDPAIFRRVLAENLRSLGLLYLLGISIAGIPLILALLFFRGFVIGFAVAFLSPNLAVGVGQVVAQNCFLVPVWLAQGTLALAFAWRLIAAPSGSRRRSLWPAFAAYTGVSVVLAAGMAWASAVEAFLAPLLVALHLH
jgi:stage II sporulation protein M